MSRLAVADGGLVQRPTTPGDQFRSDEPAAAYDDDPHDESFPRLLLALVMPQTTATVFCIPIARGITVADGDQAIPPDAERQFAARMGATTVEIPANHVAMVSHPDDVVQLIETAAEAVQAAK